MRRDEIHSKKTKARFSRLLQHPAWIRSRTILVGIGFDNVDKVICYIYIHICKHTHTHTPIKISTCK